MRNLHYAGCEIAIIKKVDYMYYFIIYHDGKVSHNGYGSPICGHSNAVSSAKKYVDEVYNDDNEDD